MFCLAVIPARGGSKGLPGKNTARLGGKPLIAWTIEAAKASKSLSRVIVSTDDAAIAAAARRCGVEVPFRRPGRLARDTSGTIEVLQHAVRWFEEAGNPRPDVVVLLQPTSPFRTAEDIDALLALMRGADSAQTVAKDGSHPMHRFTLRGRELKPLFPGMERGGRRQDDAIYRPTGAAYAARYDLLMKEGKLIGKRHRGLVCPPERSIDIDGALDLQLARVLVGASA